MSKLTAEDIWTIETFFTSPTAGLPYGDSLAAQSYEPKGSGYDPSTDTRLAKLVLLGVRSGKSAWARASLVVDQLCGRPGGGAHLDVLRSACSSRAAVGCSVPRAMAYGRELAKDAARMSELEAEYRMCGYRKLSGFETTARILALDAKLRTRHIDVSPASVRAHAGDAIGRGLINVDAEIDALIDAAAEALHVARARVLESEKASTRREDERRANLRAELAGKREAKERDRLHRRHERLRAAS